MPASWFLEEPAPSPPTTHQDAHVPAPQVPNVKPNVAEEEHVPNVKPNVEEEEHVPNVKPNVAEEEHVPNVKPNVEEEEHVPNVKPNVAEDVRQEPLSQAAFEYYSSWWDKGTLPQQLKCNISNLLNVWVLGPFQCFAKWLMDFCRFIMSTRYAEALLAISLFLVGMTVLDVGRFSAV
jgi:hypothetical protein